MYKLSVTTSPWPVNPQYSDKNQIWQSDHPRELTTISLFRWRRWVGQTRVTTSPWPVNPQYSDKKTDLTVRPPKGVGNNQFITVEVGGGVDKHVSPLHPAQYNHSILTKTRFDCQTTQEIWQQLAYYCRGGGRYVSPPHHTNQTPSTLTMVWSGCQTTQDVWQQSVYYSGGTNTCPSTSPCPANPKYHDNGLIWLSDYPRDLDTISLIRWGGGGGGRFCR